MSSLGEVGGCLKMFQFKIFTIWLLLGNFLNLSLYVGHITIPIVDFKRDSLNDDPKKYVDEEGNVGTIE